MEKNFWTVEEDDILMQNKDKTVDELLPLLPGRTPVAISSRKSQVAHGKVKQHKDGRPKISKSEKKQSKPFSPEPIVLKTTPAPTPEPKPEYHKSYIETESIQAKAEAAKEAFGTYRDPKPTSEQIAAAVITRNNQPLPILTDELTRLRCQVARLEGMIEGVKMVLDRFRVTA